MADDLKQLNKTVTEAVNLLKAYLGNSAQVKAMNEKQREAIDKWLDVTDMAEKVVFLLYSPERQAAFGSRSREMAELNFKAENSAWKFALIFVKNLLKQKGISC